MKKLILIALVLLAKVSATTAQQLSTGFTERDDLSLKNQIWPDPVKGTVPERTDYLKKSRNNRIASYCLMGGGAVILGIGALTFPKDYDILFENSRDKENKADAATTLIVVGAAAMLSSIPFTVMAGVNKRRAKLMVDSRSTGIAVPGVSKNITSLTMAIGLGK